LENNEISGRPSFFDDDYLRTVIEEDPCLTIGKVAEVLKVSWSTVREHLKKIGKVW